MNRYGGKNSSSNNNNNNNNSNFDDKFDNQDFYHHRRRSPSNFRGSGGGGGGGHRLFDSPPRQHHGGGGGGFPPMGGGGGGGGGFRPMGGGFEGNYPSPPPHPPHPPQQPHTGQKRAYPFSGRGGGSPNRDRFAGGGGNFAKLFVGSVPRAATEEDIRPLFEEHGNVIEVALIKDKKTGQPQGCCFIKYATLEEADRAIRALHNQHTLPGGMGPIQVRYADGERERLGAVEYKLFVGSLNRQATEMDVQEIFSRFGRVEDVYLMRDELKQSRGCGFVKYSDRDMALAAIDALNGIYTMRGCDQPLTVRFADPKRPRPGAGDSRGGAPAFGGPGFGPRFQAPGPRPAPNFGDAMGDNVPPNPWHPMSPQNMGPTPGIRSLGSQLLPRSGELAIPLNPGGPFGGPTDGSLPGPAVSSSSTSQQGFNQPSPLVPTVGQQISPLQKPLQSPQGLPPSFQLHPLAPVSYSQSQAVHVGQLQVPLSATQSPFSQAPPSQHFVSGQLPASRPQIQQNASSAAVLQNPLSVNLPPNLQPNSVPTTSNQQQLPVPMQQQLLQPLQQSPSQLAQMLSQQTQTLQASFQSSQQAFSQLQQQLQLMQPSNQNMTLQQNSQASKQQWAGMTPQAAGSTPASTPSTDVPSSASAPAAPVMTPTVTPGECHWTEHTSPDGFKYYHNSLTRESRWEKPEELALFEQQQQQQQKPPVQQPQTQSHPPQQASQAQQVQFQTQLQTQIHHPLQLQLPFFPSAYSASGVRNQQNTQELGYGQLPVAPSPNNPTRFQQGLQTVQDLAWKNKP
ncbi:RNA recognition motif domain - like 10 [Theobroma cacao]|nr:RNA recognition motif domain - like 10 [Theobroma cacao]